MQGNIFNDILVFTALFFLSRLLIDTLLKQDDVVILEKFVKAYQEVCNTSRLLIQVIVYHILQIYSSSKCKQRDCFTNLKLLDQSSF